VVDVPVPGLAAIAGGKYTTYRIMARDVIDVALEGYDVPASVTDRLPLVGADGLPALEASVGRLAEDHDLEPETVRHLVRRYGTLALEVLDLLARDRSLAEPLIEPGPWLRAEVVYAVTHEGAVHAEDVLARRTRMLIESSELAERAAPRVARLMAGLLGWDERRVEEETAACLRLVEAERTALAEARTAAAVTL
jgi:glycerol-3-phosphate dehydrogenase